MSEDRSLLAEGEIDRKLDEVNSHDGVCVSPPVWYAMHRVVATGINLLVDLAIASPEVDAAMLALIRFLVPQSFLVARHQFSASSSPQDLYRVMSVETLSTGAGFSLGETSFSADHTVPTVEARGGHHQRQGSGGSAPKLPPSRPDRAYQRRSATVRQRFANVFVAANLDAAPAATQAALLEALVKGHVVHHGPAHVLPHPFILVATRSESGNMSRALVERFGISITLDDTLRFTPHHSMVPLPMDHLRPAVESVFMDADIARYVTNIVFAVRNDVNVESGASPRAEPALLDASRAAALFQGSPFVTPTHVQSVAVEVLAHRVRPVHWAKRSAADIVLSVVHSVPPPV